MTMQTQTTPQTNRILSTPPRRPRWRCGQRATNRWQAVLLTNRNSALLMVSTGYSNLQKAPRASPRPSQCVFSGAHPATPRHLGRPSRGPRQEPLPQRAGNSPRPGPGPGPGPEGAVQLPLRGLLQEANLLPSKGPGPPAPPAPRGQQMAPQCRRCH